MSMSYWEIVGLIVSAAVTMILILGAFYIVVGRLNSRDNRALLERMRQVAEKPRESDLRKR